MHGRIYYWFILLPSLVVLCGMTNVVMAEDEVTPASYPASDYGMSGDTYQSAPVTQPYAGQYYSAADATTTDSDMAKRLADVEAALKKMQDKEKADKAKAAGKMTATPYGRIQMDTAAFTDDPNYPVTDKDGGEFRAIRLGLQGGGFDVMTYRIEIDFANEKVVAKDIYMNIGELPLMQNIQIGHFKEPFSLDELTSDNYTTFMERNTANDLIAPKRHFGVMAHGCTEEQNATYAVGLFAEQKDAAIVQSNNAGASATMRATWLPWYDEATDRGLLHLGAAYSYRDAYNDQWVYSVRPESHLSSLISSGTTTNVKARNEFGAETALVYGSFSVQSEYYLNAVDRDAGYSDFSTQGGYVYFSYFLTGESRPYNRKSGVFERVKPFENFFRVRDENGFVSMGKGAWEVKYRYSYLDYYDNGSTGITRAGTVADHTLGANWYLNPYTRMMFEYIYSGDNLYNGTGTTYTNIYQMRAQIDF
jgi:phosphate-selective porin OprO and OprP